MSETQFCPTCTMANIHNGICGWCGTDVRPDAPPPDESSAPLVAGMTLRTFLAVMKRLESQPFVYLDQVPAVAKPALDKFIVGLGLSERDGRPTLPARDFRHFFHYVWEGDGFPYPVRWEHDPQP